MYDTYFTDIYVRYPTCLRMQHSIAATANTCFVLYTWYQVDTIIFVHIIMCLCRVIFTFTPPPPRPFALV